MPGHGFFRVPLDGGFSVSRGTRAGFFKFIGERPMKAYLIFSVIALTGAAAWTEAAGQKESSPAQIVFYVQ